MGLLSLDVRLELLDKLLYSSPKLVLFFDWDDFDLQRKNIGTIKLWPKVCGPGYSEECIPTVDGIHAARLS